MPNAINLSQVQTVTEQMHVDLVARASMLNDRMLEDLRVKVTTDVENIDKAFIFNDKGLLARQYKQGAVKKVELGTMVENPTKVILAVTHPQDNVQKYREKEPFHVNPDGTNNAEKTTFLINKIADRHAKDVRANFFFGNEENDKLPETKANLVKLGLSLYDGIYTKVAKGITRGYISAEIGNLIITGDLMAMESDVAYTKFKAAYNSLNDDLRAADELLAYMSQGLADHIIEGYMIMHPQLSPETLKDGWKFAQMKNLTIVTHTSMGKGSQIIFSLPDNLEYVCDVRPEGQSNITVAMNPDDHNLFDYQIQTAQATRIYDYSPKVICVNEQVNTPNNVPAGDYIADIFTVATSDDEKGTAELASGEKDLYKEGDVITVRATAKSGYAFVGWSEGFSDKIINGANPFNYTFGGGVVHLVAQFEEAADGGNGGSGDGGAETPTYTAVENPSGNPAEQGWYEKSGDVYSLTEDTEVVSGKTYYVKA
jgi:hypothetical protein